MLDNIFAFFYLTVFFSFRFIVFLTRHWNVNGANRKQILENSSSLQNFWTGESPSYIFIKWRKGMVTPYVIQISSETDPPPLPTFVIKTGLPVLLAQSMRATLRSSKKYLSCHQHQAHHNWTRKGQRRLLVWIELNMACNGLLTPQQKYPPQNCNPHPQSPKNVYHPSPEIF